MAHLRLVEATPSAPQLPPLIARLGLHDELLLTEFEGFGMGVIGRTIAQAKTDPGLARLARDRYGVGVLIDPDTWRNQLPPDDRTKGYQAASFSTQGVLDLQHRTLSSEEISAYARMTLAELAENRATILVTPYHLSGGPDCPIRSTDLRLARRAVNAFRSLRLNEPRSGERFPVERCLFAAIAIRPADLLDPLARQMLVHLYSAIEVSGYLVKVVGLSEQTSVTQVTAVSDFVFSLLQASGRDVILAGGKNLSLAFVAAGLPSALLGIAEGEVFNVGSGGGGGGAKPIYHSALWRSVANSTVDAAFRAEILFGRNPCGCGHHRGTDLPRGQHELKLHTLTERLRDFRTVAAWPQGDLLKRMTRRMEEIDRVAKDAGYPATSGSFLAVAQAAERVRRRGFGAAENEER